MMPEAVVDLFEIINVYVELEAVFSIAAPWSIPILAQS